MSSQTVLHIVRHAQGYHQVPLDHPNRDIPDPELTPYGLEQCEQFCSTFPHHPDLDLICASPMRRTIRTALVCFEPEIKKNFKVLALPDAQEATDVPSDVGSDAARLKDNFGASVDYSELYNEWYVKAGQNAVTNTALHERALRLRKWIRAREETNIVLVTHGIFAHYLTGNIDENGEQTGKQFAQSSATSQSSLNLDLRGEYWQNVRWRSFQLQDDEVASLLETEESQRRTSAGEAGLHH